MDNTRGYFMELQNFSVNDGNGIRTIIFFAGCPLRCQWCSNPESQTKFNKIAYYKKTCTKCGRCKQVCPQNIDINLNDPIQRQKCEACGICINPCPTNSRKNLIYRYNGEEILNKIEKQEIFYRYSGGGVTFSGGEPTLQVDMLRKLTNKLYDKAIDLTIETSGYFNFDEVKDILKKQNLIFVDIKHMDHEKHRLHTGIGNKKVLNNISRLNELKVPIVVRIPVIHGVNSDIENIKETAKFVKDNIDSPKIELLPYHSLGDAKYEALGWKKQPAKYKTPYEQHLKELYRIIENRGIEIVSYK